MLTFFVSPSSLFSVSLVPIQLYDFFFLTLSFFLFFYIGDLLVEVSLYADEYCKIHLVDALKNNTPEELIELKDQHIFIKVGVLRAQGLPVELSKDVFVSFKFWPIDNEPIKSNKFQKMTINPELNFYHIFPVTINSDLVNHIEASALEIDGTCE